MVVDFKILNKLNINYKIMINKIRIKIANLLYKLGSKVVPVGAILADGSVKPPPPPPPIKK